MITTSTSTSNTTAFFLAFFLPSFFLLVFLFPLLVYDNGEEEASEIGDMERDDILGLDTYDT